MIIKHNLIFIHVFTHKTCIKIKLCFINKALFIKHLYAFSKHINVSKF